MLRNCFAETFVETVGENFQPLFVKLSLPRIFISRSWTSSEYTELTVADRPVAELKVALLDSAKLTSADNERRHGQNADDDDDVNLRLIDPTSSWNVHRSTEQRPRRGTGLKSRHTYSGTVTIESDAAGPRAAAPETIQSPSEGALDSTRSGEVDAGERSPATTEDSVAAVVDSAIDDVGYFSLPERRPDRDRRQTPRNRVHSWRLRQSSDGDRVEPRTSAYSSDSVGSLSPGYQARADCHLQADTVSLGSCVPGNEHCRSPREGAPDDVVPFSQDSSSRCSDVVKPDGCLSRTEIAGSSHHSEESEAAKDDRKDGVDDHPLPSFPPPLKFEPETLSEMMTKTFGRSDEVLCHAVGVVGSHRTALYYVSSLFPETGFVRRCGFDLSHPCQLDATSTGVQFLTLDAVRVCMLLACVPHLNCDIFNRHKCNLLAATFTHLYFNTNIRLL